jgi:hypothetical protein
VQALAHIVGNVHPSLTTVVVRRANVFNWFFGDSCAHGIQFRWLTIPWSGCRSVLGFFGFSTKTCNFIHRRWLLNVPWNLSYKKSKNLVHNLVLALGATDLTLGVELSDCCARRNQPRARRPHTWQLGCCADFVEKLFSDDIWLGFRFIFKIDLFLLFRHIFFYK